MTIDELSPRQSSISGELCSSKLRVLHVIPSMAPRYGGPSQAVLGMCRALAARSEVEVSIATTDADGPGVQVSDHDSNPQVKDGISVWTFPRTWSESWKYSYNLGRWLKDISGKYDILHLHANFTFSTLAGANAACRSNTPFVLRPCGMLSPYSLGRSRWRKSLYWRLLEQRNVKCAFCLQATSEIEQRELEQLVPNTKTECIPLGIDENALSTPILRGSFREKYGIRSDCVLLLFLSRLHQKKGLVELLLPALSQLPSNVFLAVVGDSDPHDPTYPQIARQSVRRLGLESRVIFTGALYGDEKWAAYDDADIYVLPSQHENFGITVLEAMSRCVPSIVCNGVQSGQYLMSAGAGRVCEWGVEPLNSEIRSFLSLTKEKRTEMGDLGRRYVRQNLTWDSTAEKLVGLYRRAICTTNPEMTNKTSTSGAVVDSDEF